jgi:glycerophosphoryl diester phosphodiesterase
VTVPTEVIAHRGASTHEPENSLAAFAAAVRFGAHGVELDVRATADGALAVVHDAHLPDGRAVAEVRAAELPGGIALLDAALDACGDLLVNVEIKADGPRGGTAIAAGVVATCRAWGGRVLVSSFDAATVARVRELDAHVATGQLTFLLDRSVPEVLATVADQGHGAWHPHHATIDADAVAAAHAVGIAVNVWTVDDPGRIATLAAWGVDAVVTNDVPTALRSVGGPGTG